ncbi:hypothetical protein DPMN_125678 [Dreissena polymorpha]|uniref:Uncharacterized protein n=1 Tax=Dreissena polymorpha TaxID=45954 RepID=A0A9D4GVK8_DREPO|nr:hypothetical protein DPMN_125678 [Dreissena polymorpha]
MQSSASKKRKEPETMQAKKKARNDQGKPTTTLSMKVEQTLSAGPTALWEILNKEKQVIHENRRQGFRKKERRQRQLGASCHHSEIERRIHCPGEI